MICLKSFDRADEFNALELEALDEVFTKYKYAFAYIGVDFSQDDVQEALLNCFAGFEDALRATIAYWYWLEEDEYLNNPNFKNPCELFWE